MRVFVCGLSGAGKSTWAAKFAKAHPELTLIKTDDFYLPVYATPNCPAGNWDEPAAFDMEALADAAAANDCIVEGIMAFRTLEKLLAEKRVKPEETRCILVETRPETCLERRMRRAEATPEETQYFEQTVLPMHELHCAEVVGRLAEKANIQIEYVRGF